MNTNSIKWLLLLLAWIGLGTFLCYKYLCNEKKPTSTLETSVIGKEFGLWQISDSSLQVQSKDYYRFLPSTSTALVPLGADIDQMQTQLSSYLVSHPNRGLNIIGYYKQDEINDNTFYPNLGLSRANAIKQLLVNGGIPAKQISTLAALINNEYFHKDTLRKGAEFSFIALENNNGKLSMIKDSLMTAPIILYFAVNSNILELSTRQQQQFSDLIYYLDNVVDAKVEVSGHTDSDGSRKENMVLSKERAEFAKSYLSTKGNIDNARMDVIGHGPDKPIANNKTPEGRSQNRRVEVQLK